MLLKNRWIVITGGSSGIGAAIAEMAGRRGNRVTIVADNREQLKRAEQSLQDAGIEADAIQCDISRAMEVDELAATLFGAGKAPDLLINNAGYGTYRTFEGDGIDEIGRLLEVNLVGHVRLTKHIVDRMVSRRSGAICFMASAAGRLPITPNATYCAAKHGMMGLAEALRFELARFGVEITAVCPGRVDTNFFAHETFRTRLTGPENSTAIPVKRVAEATIRAIEANRRVTYVPQTIGFAAWLFETLPFVSRPLYARLMKSRMDRFYADAKT